MALGLQTESSGGDFLPILKFDARAGRFFRRDRNGTENVEVDITKNFKAVLDLESIEVGYINFMTGGAPDFQLVPLGKPMPAKPTENHKQGFRIVCKLASDCGGDLREFSSCAKVVIRGIDALHEAYLAGEKENPGKLPVVVLKDTVPVTTEGKQKSTNYQPVFEIVSWVPRPKDMQPQPRGSSVPTTTSTTTATAAPTTGSTPVSAPKPAMAEAEDFG